MTWTIYRLPGDREVTRFFASVSDAEEWAARVANDSRWAGGIMRSPRGDEISIGQ